MALCQHVLELTNDTHEHIVTVHVCGMDADHKARHRCRKAGCNTIWWAHDHNPFEED